MHTMPNESLANPYCNAPDSDDVTSWSGHCLHCFLHMEVQGKAVVVARDQLYRLKLGWVQSMGAPHGVYGFQVSVVLPQRQALPLMQYTSLLCASPCLLMLPQPADSAGIYQPGDHTSWHVPPFGAL